MDSEDIVRKFHQKRGRIRDPRSGIRKKSIPDPDPRSRIQGVKKHRIPDPASRIRIRNTGFENFVYKVTHNLFIIFKRNRLKLRIAGGRTFSVKKFTSEKCLKFE
jgi:hypothetical protein